MIKRIVKMTFREEDLASFLHIFEEVNTKIKALDGCHHLELLQDLSDPAVLFTYSFWENEAALSAYRESELFNETWKETKALFAGKPEAWSVRVVDEFK